MNAPASLHIDTPVTTAEKLFTGNSARILELLGNGLSPEVVATTAGVSPSFISQLLSTEEFARQVTERRFNNLQEDTARDKRYGKMEDALLEKMEDLIPMMYKPMEILRAITVINGAKRRGASAPEMAHVNNTVINLVMPTKILQQFITNGNNQVVEVVSASSSAPALSSPPQQEERRTLVTMQSSELMNRFKAARSLANEAPTALISDTSSS